MSRARRTGRKHLIQEFTADLYQVLGAHFLADEPIDYDTQIRILDNVSLIAEGEKPLHRSPIQLAKTPFR